MLDLLKHPAVIAALVLGISGIFTVFVTHWLDPKRAISPQAEFKRADGTVLIFYTPESLSLLSSSPIEALIDSDNTTQQSQQAPSKP